MPDWLTHAVHQEVTTPWNELAVRLFAATILGFIAALLYHVSTYTPQRGINRAFLATIVLLSILIALVTVVIGNSVARAFSLVGTLSLVRFRTVVEDTRESAFVILAVGFGMAAGVGYLLAPLLAVPLVLFVGLVFRSPPVERRRPVTLQIRVGSVAFNEENLREIVRQHTRGHRLVGITTARGGAALDVAYEVQLASPTDVLALVDEVSRADGVQSVEIKE
jgi:hypothetical protein